MRDFSFLSTNSGKHRRKSPQAGGAILAILGGGIQDAHRLERGWRRSACQRRFGSHASGESLWVQTDGAVGQRDRPSNCVIKVRANARNASGPDRNSSGATGWGQGYKPAILAATDATRPSEYRTRIDFGKGSVAANIFRAQKSCGIEITVVALEQRRTRHARQKNHLARIWD